MTLFTGIIPSRHIAGVTRNGKFAGPMINQTTQVVFMDEWTNDSLCCEDAKRIFQGKGTLFVGLSKTSTIVIDLTVTYNNFI